MCVHCSRQLAWYENIPVVSFMCLRGKCRTCFKMIPFSYVLVELATAILLVFVTWYHEQMPTFFSLHYVRDVFFSSAALVTFVYDARYMLVQTRFTWVALSIGLVFNYFLGYSWQTLVIGTLTGGAFFGLQYLVSRGKWIGGGDVRLGFMMGAWLGFPSLLVALFVSYMAGLLVVLPLLVANKKHLQSEIPFGAFLMIGTVVALFYGERIMTWYLTLIRW